MSGLIQITGRRAFHLPWAVGSSLDEPRIGSALTMLRVCFVVRILGFCRNPLVLGQPLAQVNEATTFAAERAPLVVRGPGCRCSTSGARNHSMFAARILQSLSGGHQMMQQARSKSTLFRVCVALSLTDGCSMKRIVNLWRPPLISAKYLVSAGKATRTNWQGMFGSRPF